MKSRKYHDREVECHEHLAWDLRVLVALEQREERDDGFLLELVHVLAVAQRVVVLRPPRTRQLISTSFAKRRVGSRCKSYRKRQHPVGGLDELGAHQRHLILGARTLRQHTPTARTGQHTSASQLCGKA